MLMNLILYVYRSNIIQYRHGGKESNSNRKRDTIRGSGKCVQGEECTAMAISKIILVNMS